MKPASAASEKHTIPAVNKAVELLRVLAEEPGETTTKSLAMQLGIPRTTCYRILRSLVARDWVRPVEGGRHVLSLGLLPLLKPLRQVEHLGEILQPVLEELTARAQMSSKITVHQGDSAVTIARCESPQRTSVAAKLGASFHLVYGSSGAVLLSNLKAEEVQSIIQRAPEECWAREQPADVFKRIKDVQTKGWCADLGTWNKSVHAISAPLHGGKGGIAAAITLLGFPEELPPNQLAGPARLLLEAVRQGEKYLRAAGKASGENS